MSDSHSPRHEANRPIHRYSTLCAAALFVGLSLLPWSAPTAAQDGSSPQSDRCSTEAHRAFDYWVGEWAVHNADGDRVGSSRVSRISAGCALLEEWMPVQGPRGNSINFYDPRRETWRQTWVGGGGMVLDLEGGLEDGAMTLYGDRETPEGTVRDRIRWTRLEDGRVEQRWDVSADGGETWETTFRGFYERQGS